LVPARLLNLFTNSAQAMDGVGTIQVMMETTPPSCQLLIADEGPGVPPAVRERCLRRSLRPKRAGAALGCPPRGGRHSFNGFSVPQSLVARRQRSARDPA